MCLYLYYNVYVFDNLERVAPSTSFSVLCDYDL